MRNASFLFQRQVAPNLLGRCSTVPFFSPQLLGLEGSLAGHGWVFFAPSHRLLCARTRAPPLYRKTAISCIDLSFLPDPLRHCSRIVGRLRTVLPQCSASLYPSLSLRPSPFFPIRSGSRGLILNCRIVFSRAPRFATLGFPLC